MNMAALLIINDFDNYVGHYFEQKVSEQIKAEDDYMSFAVEQSVLKSTRIYQTVCLVFYVVTYGIDFY